VYVGDSSLETNLFMHYLCTICYDMVLLPGHEIYGPLQLKSIEFTLLQVTPTGC